MIHKKIYLFDWDGCLADTLSVWMDGYKKTFAKLGLYPKEKDIVSIFGEWDGPKKFGVNDMKLFEKEIFHYLSDKLPKVKLNKNAKKILRELKKRGKKTAILTSSRKQDVSRAIDWNDLGSYIDCLLTVDDVIEHKPDPEVVYKALEILKGEKDESIIIGDGIKDINCGKNAGIQTVIYYPKVNSKFYTEDYLRSLNPDYFIRDFMELIT